MPASCLLLKACSILGRRLGAGGGAINDKGKFIATTSSHTVDEIVTALNADADVVAKSLVFFESGGHTWIFASGSTVGAANDTLIKLSGITSLTSVTEDSANGDLFTFS